MPSLHANSVFASCLTLSLIAALFSFFGKQWVTHYNHNLGPTAHMENLKTLQRRLDGTIRWNFEGLVVVGLSALLQSTLIAFAAEWVVYLHWQGNHVSYPVNGLSLFGAFLVVVMVCCAFWDRWCPYQTPYTTIVPRAVGAIGTWLFHFSKLRVDFFQIFAYIRQPISRPRFVLSFGMLRRQEPSDEVIDLKSLCWMLEKAPRGPPLLCVARHISSICFHDSMQRKQIMASPHLFRLHETFWYLLMKTKRISGNNPANLKADDHIELLEHLSIFGTAVICISPQWTGGLHLLPTSTMIEIFKASFESEKHGLKNAISWKGQSLLLILPPYLSLVC